MSKTDVGKKLSCIECEYKTKWKKDMTRHQEAVHDRKMYECKQCEYKTTWKGHLVGHETSVHKRIKYLCKVCDFQTTRKALLRVAYIIVKVAAISHLRKVI